MAVVWTRAQTEYLIQELELHPILHTRSSANKDWRDQSVLQMRTAMQEVRPGTTADEIKKKIKSLRDQYRRERVKVKEARKEGNIRHKSQLWCYSMLTFFNQSDDETSPSPPPVKIKKSSSPVSSPAEHRNITVKSPTYSDLQESITDELISKPETTNGRDESPEPASPLEFLTKYLKMKESRESEHSDFLEYISSQLGKISDAKIKSDTEVGMLRVLQDGVKEQQNYNQFGRKIDNPTPAKRRKFM